MPDRTCIGCREVREQTRMLRFRRRADGRVVPVSGRDVAMTRGGSLGRSAYLCPRRGCLQQARKRRAFNRAFARAGSVDMNPKQDGPWTSLWAESEAELRREIDLLERTSRQRREHPRRRGLEELLIELSSQPESPASRLRDAGKKAAPEASVISENTTRAPKGGTRHG